MIYVIQSEERDIPLELLQQLAAVLAETPGLTHADATYRIHNSRGILAVGNRSEADRVSQRFTELGFASFILEQLLTPPRPENLNLEKPNLDPDIGLAVVARLHLVTERTVREFRQRGFAIGPALAGIPIPRVRMEERTVEDSDTRFYLDLFTSSRHWRARPGVPAPIQALLGTPVVKDAYLGAGARLLLQGDSRHLPRFDDERDYDRYIMWLYQLRYARP
jgi:hypothetical protein